MRLFIMARTLPLFLAALASPVAAQGYADPVSGLAIAPPAGLTVTSAQPRPNFDLTVDIAGDEVLESVQENGKLCSIAFKNAPQNADLSRAQINALMKKPEWRNLYKAAFELIGTVTRTSTFQHQGYAGLEFQVTPKVGPNAANIRMHVATVETSKGRTVFSCVTDVANQRKAMPIFAAIRRGTRVPE